MAKLGAVGKRFHEVVNRAAMLPLDPPIDPVLGQLHNEGDRWWQFVAGSWSRHEPSDDERADYRLQTTVAQAEDMEKIAAALERGMLGEFLKGIVELGRPPLGGSNGGWYETRKGWGDDSNPNANPNAATLQIRPDLLQLRYHIVAETRRDGDLLRVRGYLDQETVYAKSDSVQVYGQWMRTVGNQLARYTWLQLAEGASRQPALKAYEALAERGIVMSRHDWMDNPDLTNEVARAIASIKKG